jgi:AcrR family transcriptional regulator
MAMPGAEVESTPRQAVVDAAAKVFLRDGFQAASVRRIASEAGMTTGAVYSSFEGKADLFLAVLEEKLDPRLGEMYEAAREAPPREVGAHVGEEFSAYLTERRGWLILLIEFWAQAARDPKSRRAFRRRHEGLRAAISETLGERAARLGLPLALPADELATVLIALTNGFAVERLADPRAVPADLYARALDLLLA